jgi:hypothetical protein
LASDFLEQSAAQIGVADACSNERRTDAISSLTTLVFLLCIFFSSYFTVKVNGADVTGEYIAVPALVAVTTQLPAELPVISSVLAIVQGPVAEYETAPELVPPTVVRIKVLPTFMVLVLLETRSVD